MKSCQYLKLSGLEAVCEKAAFYHHNDTIPAQLSDLLSPPGHCIRVLLFWAICDRSNDVTVIVSIDELDVVEALHGVVGGILQEDTRGGQSWVGQR